MVTCVCIKYKACGCQIIPAAVAYKRLKVNFVKKSNISEASDIPVALIAAAQCGDLKRLQINDTFEALLLHHFPLPKRKKF